MNDVQTVKTEVQDGQLFTFRLPAEIAKALKACLAKDESRFACSCFYLDIYQEGPKRKPVTKFRAIATDTHRLIVIDLDGTEFPANAGSGCYQFRTMAKGEQVVAFRNAQYPNWERLFPKTRAQMGVKVGDYRLRTNNESFLRVKGAFLNTNLLPPFPADYDVYSAGRLKPYLFKNHRAQYLLMPIADN